MTIFRNERSAINTFDIVEFQMSLKSSYMVWNRIISTGKLFDAMYSFVVVTMR